MTLCLCGTILVPIVYVKMTLCLCGTTLALNFLGPNLPKYSIQFMIPNLLLGTKVYVIEIPS
jgi:hypothetical protein